MKKVLITGASGCLGKNLIRLLDNNTEWQIIAASRDKNCIPLCRNAIPISNEELLSNDTLCVDLLINCAFARGNKSSDLVSALSFNEQLIQRIKYLHIHSIVSVSSQGVYKRSQEPGVFVDENGEIEPDGLYAFAKYAQERMFTSNFGDSVTNVRLASLSNNARFLLHFVDCVIAGVDIVVSAPEQYVSLLDARDAAQGILDICNIPEKCRKNLYNLGSGKQHSILQIANAVVEEGKAYGYHQSIVRVEDDGRRNAIGMSALRMKADTGWEAKTDLTGMIRELFLQRKQ